MQSAPADPRNGDVQIVRQPGFQGAIEQKPRDPLFQALPELITEPPQMEAPLFTVDHG